MTATSRKSHGSLSKRGTDTLLDRTTNRLSSFTSALSSASSSSTVGSQENQGVYPMSTAKFQKRVLFLLTDIRNEISSLKKENMTTVSSSEESGYQIRRAETTDDLSSINRAAKNPDERNSMVQKLSIVGGVNTKDNVKRIMEKLMTNHLMSQFNLKGNKDKMSFKATALFGVVQASAMKTNKSATEQEISDAVSACLKYAPDRMGGGGREEIVYSRYRIVCVPG